MGSSGGHGGSGSGRLCFLLVFFQVFMIMNLSSSTTRTMVEDKNSSSISIELIIARTRNKVQYGC